MSPCEVVLELRQGLPCRGLVDEVLLPHEPRQEAGGGHIVAPRDPLGELVDEADGLIGEERVGHASDLELVLDVGPGLRLGQAGEVQAKGHPLADGLEGPQAEPCPEFGLADQAQGHGRGGVHVEVGEEPDLLRHGR